MTEQYLGKCHKGFQKFSEILILKITHIYISKNLITQLGFQELKVQFSIKKLSLNKMKTKQARLSRRSTTLE